MKSAREFAVEMFHPWLGSASAVEPLIEARDAEIRAEEHEARQALFALERAAHRKELREVRAAALREAVKALRSADFLADGYRAVVEMADAAHEDVCPFDATNVGERGES